MTEDEKIIESQGSEHQEGGVSWVWKDGRKRDWFPMVDKLPDLIEALHTHQAVIVDAETGTAKTRYIPQALLQEFPGVPIYHTQTLRNAVSWNGKTISKDLGDEPGGISGWRLYGEEPVESDRTLHHLLIDQSLVNQVRKDGRLPRGIIIIDEAHERKISTDLLLGLVKTYLPNSPDTSVVISSGTIDSQKFHKYLPDSDIISVKRRNFPVRVEPLYLEKNEHHTEGAIRAAEGVIDRFIKNELVRPGDHENEPDITVKDGAVIMLLPGKEDIRAAMQAIERKVHSLGCNPDIFEIVQCHGELTPKEKDKVTEPVKKAVLRFVLATEIVRSSVTPADVVGVIDSLQIKRTITNEKGIGHLDKIQVSKAEADQGKGRGGRTRSAFYIPVTLEDEYKKLREWPQPAILREPIGSVVLQIADVDLSVRDFPYLDRPDEKKLSAAIVRMQKIGALDQDEKITDTGELLVRFPIDPERAKSLVVADTLGVLPEVMIATSVIENEGFYFTPRSDERPVLSASEQTIRELLSQRSKEEVQADGVRRQLKPDEVNLRSLPSFIRAHRDGRYTVDTSSHEADFSDFEVEDLVKRIWKEYAGDSKSDVVVAINAFRDYIQAKRTLRTVVQGHNETVRRQKNGSMWTEDFMLRKWCEQRCFDLKRLQFIEHTLNLLEDEVRMSPLTLKNSTYQSRVFEPEAITKSLFSGMVDNILVKNDRGYKGALGEKIFIGRSSIVSDEKLIFTCSVRKNIKGNLFADMVVPVQSEWIEEMMPARIKVNWEQSSLTAEKTPEGTIVGKQRVYVDDLLIKEIQTEPPTDLVAQYLAQQIRLNSELKHPDAEYNEDVISYIQSLQARMLPVSGVKFNERSWYAKQLFGCANYNDARTINLKLTDEVISQILGEQYQQYIQRVTEVYPDTVSVEGVVCQVRYYRPSEDQVVQASIMLPLPLMEKITPDRLPTIHDAQILFGIQFQGKDYFTRCEVKDWDQYHAWTEKSRIDEAWNQFQSATVSTLSDITWFSDKSMPLPDLPTEEYIWDTFRNQKAYPSWVSRWSGGGTEYKVAWFKTQTEATEALEKFDEQVHFAERASEVKNEYLRLEKILNEIKEKGELIAYGFTEVERGKGGSYGESLEYNMTQLSIYSGNTTYKAQPRTAKKELKKMADRIADAMEYKRLNDEIAEAVKSNYAAFDNQVTRVRERFGEIAEIKQVSEQLASAAIAGHYIGIQSILNVSGEIVTSYVDRIRREQAGEIIIEPRVPLHNSGNGRAIEKAWVITPMGGIIKPKETNDDTATFDDIGCNDLIASLYHSNYGYEYEERFTTHRVPKQITNEQIRALEELRTAQNVYFIGNIGGWDPHIQGDIIVKTQYKSKFSDFTGSVDYDDRTRIDTDEWEVKQSGSTYTLLPQKRTQKVRVGERVMPATTMALAMQEAVGGSLEDGEIRNSVEEPVVQGKDKNLANREAWQEIEEIVQAKGIESAISLIGSKDIRKSELATVIAITSMPWSQLTAYSPSSFSNSPSILKRLESIQKDITRRKGRGEHTELDEVMNKRISQFRVMWDALRVSKLLMNEWVGLDESLQTSMFYKFVDETIVVSASQANNMTSEQLKDLFIEVVSR